MSQSLSGWDGDFHLEDLFEVLASLWSQSLSGWDGDFHLTFTPGSQTGVDMSQSLSGWDGDFHRRTL
ncbi:MAG: hypothetical protein ACP5LK_07125, partial [Candidatus Bipolaricaulaceae bacterium]